LDELNLSRIEVNVEDGVVYLSGMSDDHESKVHAEKEARALAGDKRIINKIEVDF
jgi:osmotically-inducible protein OsmY